MKKSSSTSSLTLFTILQSIFLIILAEMFVPGVIELLGGKLFLVFIAAFFIVGLWLFAHTYLYETNKKQRLALKLTAVGAVSFPLLVVLHNMFYAFGIIFTDPTFHAFLGSAEIISFLAAIFVAPVLFMVGSVMVIRNRICQCKSSKTC